MYFTYHISITPSHNHTTRNVDPYQALQSQVQDQAVCTAAQGSPQLLSFIGVQRVAPVS